MFIHGLGQSITPFFFLALRATFKKAHKVQFLGFPGGLFHEP
jgi:hypothetical protein